MTRAVVGIEVTETGQGIVRIDDEPGASGHVFSEDTLDHDGFVKFVGVQGCEASAGSPVAT